LKRAGLAAALGASLVGLAIGAVATRTPAERSLHAALQPKA